MTAAMGDLPAMLGWLRDLLVPPRQDLFGRLRYLRGRAPDPTLCQIVGIDPHFTERAVGLICSAFSIPAGQQYCLRPDDTLMALYLGGYKRRFVDNMEFESLFGDLNQAVGRQMDEAEMLGIKTVEDVIRFLAAHARA
jgi:hypothetical protein